MHSLRHRRYDCCLSVNKVTRDFRETWGMGRLWTNEGCLDG